MKTISWMRGEGRRAAGILPWILAAALARSGPAAEVTLGLADDAIWEGQSTTLTVSIIDPTSGLGEPALDPVPGLVLRGPLGSRTHTFTLQGKTSVRQIYNYSIHAAAGKTGTFTIGPATVPRKGGPDLRSGTVELRVFKNPGLGVSFRRDLEPEGGHVGAPFRVVYTIAYTGEYDQGDDDFFSFPGRSSTPFGLAGLDLPVLSLRGVRVSPLRVQERRQAARVSLRGDHELLIQEGFAAGEGDTGRKTIVFGFEVVPLVTGKLELSPASVRMRIRTGRTEVVRDGLFRRRRHEVVEYEAKTDPSTYVVEQLPETGRPQGFTGAIGRFRVGVRADETSVAVLDPIVLTIRVTGDGLLEELQPPAWSEMETLTRDFVVPPDYGSRLEGGAKVFEQIVRPKNENVTRIPPIPFPYFDPVAGEYRVARSDPIPIEVRQVRRVTVEDAIPSARAVAGGTTPPPASVAEKGIGANFTTIGEVHAVLDPRARVLSAPFLATTILPPAVYALLLLGLRVSRRSPRLRTRERALGRATARMAKRHMGYGDLSDAYQDYYRERLDLPPGELTPEDLSTELERRGMSPPLRGRAARILENLLAGRFGGADVAPEELRAEALATIREVDSC